LPIISPLRLEFAREPRPTSGRLTGNDDLANVPLAGKILIGVACGVEGKDATDRRSEAMRLQCAIHLFKCRATADEQSPHRHKSAKCARLDRAGRQRQNERHVRVPVRVGRPRGYDPEVALDKAAQLFWKHGYSAVSLDDLVLATGMKRPSLAAAFGDKRAIYLRTLERYRDRSRAQAKELLAESPDLKTFLNRFYAAAIDIYVSSGNSALG
jgi:hypothetical protein